MPGYNSTTGVLDIITRTYKNGAGDTIATQTITVMVSTIMPLTGAGMALVLPDSLSTNRFKRTAKLKLNSSKSRKSGASGIVATIETSGSYDVQTVSGNDILSVTYLGDGTVNDLVIPVRALNGVFTIGDSV